MKFASPGLIFLILFTDHDNHDKHNMAVNDSSKNHHHGSNAQIKQEPSENNENSQDQEPRRGGGGEKKSNYNGACLVCVTKHQWDECDYNDGANAPCNYCRTTLNARGNPMECASGRNARPRLKVDGQKDERRWGNDRGGRGRGTSGNFGSNRARGRGRGGNYPSQNLNIPEYRAATTPMPSSSTCNEEIAAAKKAIAASKEEALRKQNAALNDMVAALQKENAAVHKQSAAAHMEHVACRKELAAVQKHNAALQKQNADLKDELQSRLARPRCASVKRDRTPDPEGSSPSAKRVRLSHASDQTGGWKSPANRPAIRSSLPPVGFAQDSEPNTGQGPYQQLSHCDSMGPAAGGPSSEVRGFRMKVETQSSSRDGQRREDTEPYTPNRLNRGGNMRGNRQGGRGHAGQRPLHERPSLLRIVPNRNNVDRDPPSGMGAGASARLPFSSRMGPPSQSDFCPPQDMYERHSPEQSRMSAERWLHSQNSHKLPTRGTVGQQIRPAPAEDDDEYYGQLGSQTSGDRNDMGPAYRDHQDRGGGNGYHGT